MLEVLVVLADSGRSPRRVLTYCEDTNIVKPNMRIRIVISC